MKLSHRLRNLSHLESYKIKTVDFEKRVGQSDRSLVSELAQWSYMDGLGVSLLYCCCHNESIYNGDDYSIFDSVIKSHLGGYISAEEYKKIFGTKPILRSIILLWVLSIIKLSRCAWILIMNLMRI